MNIVLVGYRGTGKSTVAKLLAEKMNWPSISVDKEIHKQEGETILNIVEEHGWLHYQNLQTNMIQKLAKLDHHIIDTGGGGVVLRSTNVEILRECGKIFWLTADPEVIVKRIQDSKCGLPIKKGRRFLTEVEEALEKREPLYKNAAHYRIDTDDSTLDEVASDIADLFRAISV